jgi:hypothetical protein
MVNDCQEEEKDRLEKKKVDLCLDPPQEGEKLDLFGFFSAGYVSDREFLDLVVGLDLRGVSSCEAFSYGLGQSGTWCPTCCLTHAIIGHPAC